MAKAPQIAIVGAGIFVKTQYIPRLSKISDLVYLKAIWSRSEESARGAIEIAQKYFPGVECKWGDKGLDDIIEDNSILGVAVVLAGQAQIKKLQSENRLHEIVEGNLKSYEPKEVEIMIQVALLCTQTSPEERPTMSEVVKMLQGVGMAERWAEQEQLEHVRNKDFSLYSHQFAWDEETTHDQEAIQLSTAR